MKKCGTSTLDMLLSVLASLVCGGIALFAFRKWLYEGSVIILYEVALFGGAALYGFWHIGSRGFFYDEEKIVFALSRNDHREFRWEELQGAKEKGKIDICYQSLSGVWDFYFPGKRNIKQLSATKRMAGYDELIAMLKKKNVPAHEANGGIVYDKEWLAEIYHEIMDEQLNKDERNQK